jgi:sugar lactone lactonase YvrE
MTRNVRSDCLLATRAFLCVCVVAIIQACNSGGEPPTDPDDPGTDQEGVLYNVAGVSGESGNSGDGGPAVDARLSFPVDVAVNLRSEVLIVDAQNHCIRSVAYDGTISRLVGTGVSGDGTDGTANTMAMTEPASVSIGPGGDLWIAAWKNDKIKWVDAAGVNLTTPIGTTAGFSGDNGPAIVAQLHLPSSTVLDMDGNLYISDQLNQRIRKVDTAGNITTFAGTGEKGYLDGPGGAAKFSFPTGTLPVPGGRIGWAHHPYGFLVADTENNRIRFINIETREVFTVAGTGQAGYSGDDGRAVDAQLNYPTDVLMTEDHEIFFVDSRNHVIRKINELGYISTVVGTGLPGDSPDGTKATEARLRNPSGISWLEATRTLYIADTYNHEIKKVKLPR